MTVRPAQAMVFADALVTLVAASIAIRVLPLRSTARWALAGTAVRDATVDDLAEIRRAIGAWSRRVPWRCECLEQGITMARMLARRQIRATFHYGAAMDGAQLEAHAWVTAGDLAAIGCENAGEFALLSQFTNASS